MSKIYAHSPRDPDRVKMVEDVVDLIQASTLTDQDKGRLTRFMRLMERNAAELSGEELQEARENAGLSRGQAAKLLGIDREGLEMIETCPGDVGLNPLVAGKMDHVYGIGRTFGGSK